MIEVKEIRNTENGKDFISKDYLREKAVECINDASEHYMRAFQTKSSAVEHRFCDIGSKLDAYVHIGLITNEERSRFVDYIDSAMKGFTDFSATLYPCGLITLRYIGK